MARLRRTSSVLETADSIINVLHDLRFWILALRAMETKYSRSRKTEVRKHAYRTRASHSGRRWPPEKW